MTAIANLRSETRAAASSERRPSTGELGRRAFERALAGAEPAGPRNHERDDRSSATGLEGLGHGAMPLADGRADAAVDADPHDGARAGRRADGPGERGAPGTERAAHEQAADAPTSPRDTDSATDGVPEPVEDSSVPNPVEREKTARIAVGAAHGGTAGAGDDGRAADGEVIPAGDAAADAAEVDVAGEGTIELSESLEAEAGDAEAGEVVELADVADAGDAAEPTTDASLDSAGDLDGADVEVMMGASGRSGADASGTGTGTGGEGSWAQSLAQGRVGQAARGAAPDGTAPMATRLAEALADADSLQAGSLGSGRARVVVGEGADRVALMVTMARDGVRVEAQAASTEAAASLRRSAGELAQSLERQGVHLSSFTAQAGGGDRGAHGSGAGGRSGRGDGAEHDSSTEPIIDARARGVRIVA